MNGTNEKLTIQEIDSLFEEFEVTMTKRWPPDEYGEDSDLSVLYSICEDFKNECKTLKNKNGQLNEVIEKAFVAGRSNTLWEQFKKDNDLQP